MRVQFFLVVIPVVILLLIILNILFFYLFIRIAVKRCVEPYLNSKGYTLVNYKWAGFWDTGDFKNEQLSFALFKTGPKFISIFSYVYFNDLYITKRTTIKIDLVGLSIVKVTYSNNI